MLGFFTPWVAFLASGEMAFAYFMAHAPNGAWPIMTASTAASYRRCIVSRSCTSRLAALVQSAWTVW